jgi:hypothetical protein
VLFKQRTQRPLCWSLLQLTRAVSTLSMSCSRSAACGTGRWCRIRAVRKGSKQSCQHKPTQCANLLAASQAELLQIQQSSR